MSITFADKRKRDKCLPEFFLPYVREWFYSKFKELTPPQQFSLRLIHEKKNALITAPTGSGKSLAGFLTIINELFKLAEKGKLEDKIYCLYISPLKALNNDIKRNLQTPLTEIKEIAETKFGKKLANVRVAVRTGDVLPSEKAKQLKRPPHILITTPESLAIMLNAPKFREMLKTVKWVIIDEIHELANSKRGVHLSLSLERLRELTRREFVRIGLGATLHPIEEAAKFLVGYDNKGKLRKCIVVDVTWEKPYDLKVFCPVKDIVHVSADELNKKLYEILDNLIEEHTTTLIFTNTRSGTERVVYHLKEKWKKKYAEVAEELIGAHHGSLSREVRLEVEEKLKRGELKAVVCVSPCCYILCEDGMKKISEIKNNENILSINPKTTRITLEKFGKVRKVDYNKKGIRIVTSLGFEIDVTKGHEFLTINENGELVWKKAEEFAEGEYIAVVRKLNFKEREVSLLELLPPNAYLELKKIFLEKLKKRIKEKYRSIKIFAKTLNLSEEYLKKQLNGFYPFRLDKLNMIIKDLGVNFSEKHIKEIRTDKKRSRLRTKKFTSSLARLLGFWLAEGSWKSESLTFFSSDISMLRKYAKSLTKLEVKYVIRKQNSTTYGLEVNFKLLKEIFMNLVETKRKKSLNGRFPELIYSLPKKHKAEFLSGYFDGDGFLEIKRGKIFSAGIITFNKNFAEGIRNLLLCFGIVATIRKKVKNNKVSYSVVVLGGEYLRKFFSILNSWRSNFSASLLNKGYCNLDVIPNLGKKLRKIRKTLGISTYYLQKACFYNPEKVEISAREITRRSLKKLLKFYLEIWKQKIDEKPYEINALLKLANGDLFFDKIKSISEISLKRVYGIINAEKGNYISNCFVSKNCSTSLELGVDIGHVDLVVQLGSPKSVTRAVQRIGRSGHKFKETAKGRIIALDRDDLVEVSVMLACALKRKLDKFKVPKNCLDVLTQHIVGMALEQKWKIDKAYRVVKRSYCFHSLSKEDFLSVLRYLSGSYVSLQDRRVYGKIWLDEQTKEFGRRGRYTRVIYYLNLGTIPDEVKVDVYLMPQRKYIGGLEEGFLERLRPGDIFVLGGKLYYFLYARGMRCYVKEAPKDALPTIPSWFSEMLPLSFELAEEIRKFREEMLKKFERKESREKIISWILKNMPVDKNTANAIYLYFKEQYNFALIPKKNEVLIEYTRDLHGRRFLIFHALFGRKVNDALSRALALVISNQISSDVLTMISDNGFALLIPENKEVNVEKAFEELFEEDVEELLKKNIRRTELMLRRFRHNAARSFLVLRNYKGHKISVAKQQTNARTLLNVCEKIDENFPVIKETYREILYDVMDLENARKILEWIKSGKAKLKEISTRVPSPFAHNLILLGESDIILMQDRKKRLLELYEAVMKEIGKRKR